MKKLTPLLITILITATAAAGFGSFPYSTQTETSTTSTSFTIGLVNTGDDPVRITLTAQTRQDLNVTFSDNDFLLPPSPTATAPDGSGWLHLGDSRYAQPTDIAVNARIHPSTDTRDHTFTVTIQAHPSNITHSGGVEPRIIHAQEHTFHLTSTSPKISPGSDIPDPEYNATWEITGDDTDTNDTAAGSSDEPPQQDDRATNKTREPPDVDKEGVDRVTAILAGGVLLTLLYTLRLLL